MHRCKHLEVGDCWACAGWPRQNPSRSTRVYNSEAHKPCSCQAPTQAVYDTSGLNSAISSNQFTMMNVSAPQKQCLHMTQRQTGLGKQATPLRTINAFLGQSKRRNAFAGQAVEHATGAQHVRCSRCPVGHADLRRTPAMSTPSQSILLY